MCVGGHERNLHNELIFFTRHCCKGQINENFFSILGCKTHTNNVAKDNDMHRMSQLQAAKTITKIAAIKRRRERCENSN